MKNTITRLAFVMLLLVIPAQATPYQFSYEANTPGSFPEDEGWDRGFGFGGADRSIENGILTLSSSDIQVFDFYEMDMGGNLNPDPGEMFFAEWRLKIDANSDPDFGDASVVIARDSTGGAFGGADVAFAFFEDRVIEEGDLDNVQTAFFAPNVFHVFRFESSDMQEFDFFVDDELAFAGVFAAPSVNASFVNFGDGVQGVSSTSEWDYFQFGVIPEPFFGSLVFLSAGVFFIRQPNKKPE